MFSNCVKIHYAFAIRSRARYIYSNGIHCCMVYTLFCCILRLLFSSFLWFSILSVVTTITFTLFYESIESPIDLQLKGKTIDDPKRMSQSFSLPFEYISIYISLAFACSFFLFLSLVHYINPLHKCHQFEVVRVLSTA